MLHSFFTSIGSVFSITLFGLLFQNIPESNIAEKSKTSVKPTNYDENLVEVVRVSGKYDAVFMKRKGDHIKAKYFAASLNGRSIQERYQEWARGRNIVMYSSGTYMNSWKQPVGLTIDNGIRVNDRMENFDGLVIVYATGGVVATNLKMGNLKIKCDGTDRQFDLINGGSMLKQQFLDCAAKVEATVFQTHLLVYNNEILLAPNSSVTKRERRFLAVCQDPESKEVTHVVVNTPVSAAASLADATKEVVKMIKAYGAGNIVFMVNLDTGDGDVFNLFEADGSSKIQGTRNLDQASNLLVYYYE